MGCIDGSRFEPSSLVLSKCLDLGEGDSTDEVAVCLVQFSLLCTVSYDDGDQ